MNIRTRIMLALLAIASVLQVAQVIQAREPLPATTVIKEPAGPIIWAQKKEAPDAQKKETPDAQKKEALSFWGWILRH
jgi:hypothetical protein